MEQLKENSLYRSDARRKELVDDKEATMTALIINLFGTLGLLKIDAKKVKARRVLNSQEQLQIGKIAETHNDMVLVIRLGVDAGIIPTPVAAQMIRLLRELRRKKAAEHADIDDDLLRDWLQKMHWRSNPPVQQLRATVLDFFEGLTTLEEFTARLYDKLFERKELIVNYGMEFFPMARQYQGLFHEIKLNSKDWNEVDDGTVDPISVEQRINDLIDQLVDPRTTADEVISIGNRLESLNSDKEIAARIVARTIPNKHTLKAMIPSEAFNSLKYGAWSILRVLDRQTYDTLNAVYVSLHLNKFWTDTRSVVEGYFSFGDLNISFDAETINSGITVAGMSITDAHEQIAEYIRCLIVRDVVNARSVDEWERLQGYIRSIRGQNYEKGLMLFSGAGLYKATVDLSLSNRDAVMLFVRGTMGDIVAIEAATYDPVVASALKKQGIEIDHVKHTVSGIDKAYPGSVEFLNNIAMATKSGYVLLYADVIQDDEYYPLVSAFSQGYDGLTRALTIFLRKFESDPDDAFADLFGTQKYSKDIADPSVASEFFDSLSKHPRLAELTVGYVKSLLGSRDTFIHGPRGGFLSNFHKLLFPQMATVDFSKLYRKTPTSRAEAREIEGSGRFVNSALTKPTQINVMEHDDAKLLATAFHAANPSSILAYYEDDMEGYPAGYQVEWAKQFIREIPTNRGLLIDGFMTETIAKGLSSDEWIRILTVFTEDNEKTTQRVRAAIILKGMEAGVKFGTILPHELYAAFIVNAVKSSGDVSDYSNVLDGLDDQHIRDITAAAFSMIEGYDNHWAVSSFMSRNLQHPVARQHFMELYNASPKKDTIQEALSDQGCAAFLPKDQYLVIFKASLATAESMGERFSHISVANEFLKRDDVAKEDVEVVLGRLVKAIEQYDNGDDDVYYTDDSDMITADGAASTISEIISVAMERFPAEVDDSLVTVAGSKLVEQVAGKIAQATILDRFSESYQSDIIKPYKAQTREEVLRSMRFNKVGLNLMNSFYDPKKPLSENIKAAESLNVVIEPLKVTPINATEEELIEATAKIERFNKHAHSNGNTGILVLRMFDVSIPQQHAAWPQFAARMKEEGKPNEYMETVFHGTGSVAASMILRYGFTIPDFDSDAGMSGRALGDGVYFTNVSDKSTLYIGDDGYKGGITGYLFEMDAQLGQPAEVNSYPRPDTDGTLYDHRSGGFPEATNHQDFISPEWAVFDPHGQVRIRRAYEVKIVNAKRIENLLNGKVSYSGLVESEKPKSFIEYMISEAEGDKEKHTATYIFADGMVPVGKGKAVPWKKAKIKGVRIESGQQGVIISVTSSRVKEDTVYRDCSGGEFALSSAYGRYAYHLGLVK